MALFFIYAGFSILDYHSGNSLTGFFGFEGTKKGPTGLKILIINYHANSRK